MSAGKSISSFSSSLLFAMYGTMMFSKLVEFHCILVRPVIWGVCDVPFWRKFVWGVTGIGLSLVHKLHRKEEWFDACHLGPQFLPSLILTCPLSMMKPELCWLLFDPSSAQGQVVSLPSWLLLWCRLRKPPSFGLSLLHWPWLLCWLIFWQNPYALGQTLPHSFESVRWPPNWQSWERLVLDTIPFAAALTNYGCVNNGTCWMNGTNVCLHLLVQMFT